MSNIKISIITPSYNQGHFIRDTIESVMNQNFSNYEHIVVDGASNDNTVAILKEYSHLKWISEKDRGPVDAINKGFSMATGEIVTWLNSDDYFEKDIFSDLINLFSNVQTKIVVGNMVQVTPEKKMIYVNDDNSNYNIDYLTHVNSDIVKQPSTFFRKELFYEVGGFDSTLKLVWDYDLFLKMFKKVDPVFINRTLAYQRIYATTLSRKFSRTQAIEIYRISKRHGAKLFDKINKLALIRFLFPSTISDKPALLVRLIRRFKNLFN